MCRAGRRPYGVDRKAFRLKRLLMISFFLTSIYTTRFPESQLLQRFFRIEYQVKNTDKTTSVQRYLNAACAGKQDNFKFQSDNSENF
jgi:hypothetical protein